MISLNRPYSRLRDLLRYLIFYSIMRLEMFMRVYFDGKKLEALRRG
jgi:hypothetical protein